jgi:hypothetical protein
MYGKYMERIFVVSCCIGIFLSPFFITGKCSRINYIIKMSIVTILEILIILWLFSYFVLNNIWEKYVDAVIIIYAILYIYNSVITVKRCNFNCMKKYNFIIPFLQFVKLFIVCFFATVASMGDGFRLIWGPILFCTAIINISQVLYLSPEK